MSRSGHRWTAVVGSVVACALLSGCFGSGSEPTAAHGPRHHRTGQSSAPTESPSTSSPTGSTSTPAGSAVLSFSPKSGGKHLDECQTLVPGDDPAEFLYYPVVIKAASSLTLATVTTEHTQGVVDAGAWVAPTGPTQETGTFKGWPPPRIVTGDSNLEWTERVPANGATLQPGTSYNVFLRLQVDPTPGDSQVTGLDFEFQHVESASSLDLSVTWHAKTTFSMSC
jgi:hypothetical protein